MSYHLNDFSESLKQVSLPSKPKRVVAAWGNDGDWAGWSGGFLMELEGGEYAYLAGWCDTTGWGCQDGAEAEIFKTQPKLGELKKFSQYSDTDDSYVDEPWDLDPQDLNKWIQDGMKDPYDY